MSNIRLPNGLILTCYRIDVGEVLIKVWGTARPFFRAEITYNGHCLDVKVDGPGVSGTQVLTIKEAIEWLSEQWDKRKAESAQSKDELISQYRSFVRQWESLAAQHPPTPQ